MSESRFTSVVVNYGPIAFGIAAQINLFSYTFINGLNGGSANNGTIQEGRYYVGNTADSMAAEVSAQTWWLNLLHGYSVWILLALVLIPSFLIVLYGAYRGLVLEDLPGQSNCREKSPAK